MELSECLAYEVLCDPSNWLIKGSFGELVAMFKGVQFAIRYSSEEVSEWNLHGSLRLNAHQSVIDEVRRVHSDSECVSERPFTDAWIQRLRALLEQDALSDELGPVYQASPRSAGVFILYHDFDYFTQNLSELAAWRQVIKRPPILMGGDDVVTWRAFLLGCTRGAQWLGVEPSLYAIRTQACFDNYAQTHFESGRDFALSQSAPTLLKSLAFKVVEDL